MMLYPAMSELMKDMDSRYLLVNVVAHRAREISEDAENHEIALKKKAVSMAIDEIADGYLSGKVWTGAGEAEE